MPKKLVKKRWYSTNFGDFKCSSRRCILSRVGRAITIAFMCLTLSEGSPSKLSTKYTCLDIISFIEDTMETMVLVSLSKSRHFMPETT